MRICGINVGAITDRSGKIVEMLELRSVNVCCVQETSCRGNSVRMICGKAQECKLFWIGNEKGWPRNG